MSSSTATTRHHFTNSPSAWGYGFSAISSLTTKLACVTLSWSACSLDKTACLPLIVGERQLYTARWSFQGIEFSIFGTVRTLKVYLFHYGQHVPTNLAHGLSFHFYKEKCISPFVQERATLCISFSYLVAVFCFSQRWCLTFGESLIWLAENTLFTLQCITHTAGLIISS